MTEKNIIFPLQIGSFSIRAARGMDASPKVRAKGTSIIETVNLLALFGPYFSKISEN